MTDSVIARFLGAAVAVIAPALQLWDALKKRLIKAHNDEAAVGNLGRPYLWALKIPIGLSVIALLAIVLLALSAIVGGILISNAGTAAQLQALQQSRWAWVTTLFEGALWIAFAYLVLAVVVYFDVPLRFALLVTNFWRYQPGWISARRMLTDTGPLNVDPNACEAVANKIFRAMADGTFQYDQHRAAVPQGLNKEELANCLLVACTIESKLHDLKRKVPFGKLYSSVAAFGTRDGRPLAPASLRSSDAAQIYAQLQATDDPADSVFPDEQSIGPAVQRVLERLRSKFDASAFELACARLSRAASLARVHRRLGAFEPFQHEHHEGMRVLFVKLAVRWQIWPDANPGPFSYAFNSGISILLMNLGCVTPRVDEKSINIDSDFRRLVAWTEMQIVNRVSLFIRSQADQRTTDMCTARFGCPPSTVKDWQVADEVDYFLFSQGRTNDGGFLGQDAMEPWQIEKNTLVRK